jgi:hypothetical protein
LAGAQHFRDESGPVPADSCRTWQSLRNTLHQVHEAQRLAAAAVLVVLCTTSISCKFQVSFSKPSERNRLHYTHQTCALLVGGRGQVRMSAESALESGALPGWNCALLGSASEGLAAATTHCSVIEPLQNASQQRILPKNQKRQSSQGVLHPWLAHLLGAVDFTWSRCATQAWTFVPECTNAFGQPLVQRTNTSFYCRPAVQVIREHYLRDDIWYVSEPCNAASCRNDCTVAHSRMEPFGRFTVVAHC